MERLVEEYSLLAADDEAPKDDDRPVKEDDREKARTSFLEFSEKAMIQAKLESFHSMFTQPLQQQKEIEDSSPTRRAPFRLGNKKACV